MHSCIYPCSSPLQPYFSTTFAYSPNGRVDWRYGGDRIYSACCRPQHRSTMSSALTSNNQHFNVEQPQRASHSQRAILRPSPSPSPSSSLRKRGWTRSSNSRRRDRSSTSSTVCLLSLKRNAADQQRRSSSCSATGVSLSACFAPMTSLVGVVEALFGRREGSQPMVGGCSERLTGRVRIHMAARDSGTTKEYLSDISGT